VNTIHDLSYYSPPSYFPLSKRLYKRFFCRVSMRKSRALIADSEFTRREIQRRFGCRVPAVYVVHPGVDTPDVTEVSLHPVPFLLHVGTLEERKNLITLVNAYSCLRARTGIPHRLVLVGQPGYRFDRIRRAIASSPSRNSIEVPGYVSCQDVMALYRQAEVYIFPSYYEGFGLPALEAMACGTPVICSRAASLPEVAGNAAEYFDPTSPEELAAVIEKVLASSNLQSEMKRKGLARAKLFSWQECARRHMEVYRSVLG
jgi:glycosyltransferase involved in cell wall biosynthesis